MDNVLIKINHGYGLTVLEDAEHIRYVDNNGNVFIVKRQNVDIIPGSPTRYVLTGKSYRELSQIPEDIKTLNLLHRINVHH